MSDETHCGELAGDALDTARTMIEIAEQHRNTGNLRHAVTALQKASIQLGRADSLVEFCQLGQPLAVTRLFARAAVLRDRLGEDCEHGWKAGLSDVIDPYEAYRKLRKPLPPQKGGAHGGKKGKKGYDRKRDKQRSRQED